MGFRACWAATSGATGSLLLIVLLPSLVFGALSMAVGILLAQLLAGIGLGQSLTGVALHAFLMQSLSFFGIAVGVSALSISYDRLKPGSVAAPAD